MDESRSIPTATSFRTLQVDVLDARRRELKAAGRKLSFTHLIAWAIVQAARDMPVMGNSYAEEDGKPQRVVPGGDQPRPGRRRRAQGRHALAGRAGARRTRASSAFPDFVARYDELVAGARDNTLPPDAYTGRQHQPDQPGRHRDGRERAAADAGPGHDRGHRRDRLPARPRRRPAPSALRELGVQKVMTMTSTYDHRVIQGAESGAFLRRVDQLLQGEDGFYEGVLEALGLDGVVRGRGAVPQPVTADEPVPAATTPAAAPVAGRGAAPGGAGRHVSLVKAHRMHGHLAARLDPLGSDPVGDPALDPATVNLTEELMRRIPASVLRVAVPGETFADALPRLRDVYTGTIAYEIEHISDHEQRVWLRQAIESGDLPPAARAPTSSALPARAPVQGRGARDLPAQGVPRQEAVLDRGARRDRADARPGDRAGLRRAAPARSCSGMAHRGRLNVLAHNVCRPYESILVEFEGEQTLVGRHRQARGRHRRREVPLRRRRAPTGRGRARGVTVTLSPNPSHLEYVNPVIEGRARADQTSRKARELAHDPNAVAAGADPRRRRLPRPGRRRRDAQPAGARGLHAPAARCT